MDFNNLMRRAVFILGCLITTLFTIYSSQINKETFYFDHKLKAEQAYGKFVTAYNEQASILSAVQAYYMTDRQVTYGEFSSLVQRVLSDTNAKNENQKIPIQVGWYSIEDGSSLNIILNTQSSTYTLADKYKNAQLSFLQESPEILSSVYAYYDGKEQFLAHRAMAKIPDDTSDDTLFGEAGYFYLIIDIKNLIEDHLNQLATGYKISIKQHADNNSDTNEQDMVILLQKDAGFIDDGQVLFIKHTKDWNAFNLQYNYNSFLIFVFGILISIAVSQYINSILKRNLVLSEARDKAEELSRLKSDFLATMSHEIRTPMNGILGMAELIIDAHPSSQIEGYAKIIINSGESLQHIIDDILDFSKIEAGKLEIDLMAVNLLDLSDDITTLHALKAREKALELAVHYMLGTEQFIFSDPVRIRQILGNLISNAIKFTDKGHVALTVEEIPDDNMSGDQVTIKFSVSDTGIGLSADAQNKVFERFQQADNSTTRKYGGTGLGLSICKNLVDLMGGEMGMESTIGKGSTFWFTLPVKRNVTEGHIQPFTFGLQGIRVLVVDDFPIIRQLVSEQLSRAGMRCDVAPCGKDALSMMKKAHAEGDPYKIGIIDYLMPHMNGEMLSLAINDYPELRDTCLILLTAAGNPLADYAFVEKGFSAYIAKPVHNLALIDSISIIWEKYQQGEKNTLIHVDTRGLGKEFQNKNELTLPGIQILVAEDNLVNQIFIKEILGEMKADYTVVSNGKEALDAVQKKEFDLIIMDCLMPEMDGFEATGAIQALIKEGKIKPVPICALTANALKEDRKKCLEAGMDDYLSKPVRKKELKDKVVSLINGASDINAKMQQVQNVPNLTINKVINNQSLDTDIPILDVKAVENARNILKGKYDEMVDLYIDNSWERVEEIVQAINENNIETIIRQAHTLKSTSKQMGAFKLAAAAKMVEYNVKAIQKENIIDFNISTITTDIDNIKKLLSETRHAFDKRAA